MTKAQNRVLVPFDFRPLQLSGDAATRNGPSYPKGENRSSLLKLAILYSMHLDVCCFCYHVSWQKKIIIRPNFDCSMLFKLFFFLFQLFIVLYFVVCMISCYHFVVK